MRLISREIFWPAAAPGVNTYGDSFYVRPTGVAKMCRRAVETKNDLVDVVEYGFSDDNGATWSALRPTTVFETFPDGSTLRRWVLPSFVDPVNGRLLTLYNEAVMPHDDALLDGMTNTFLKYRVSLDGGHTDVVDETIIQRGYTPERPLRGVVVGKNAVMLGDNGCEPIRTRGGRLLVPVQVCPLGPDGTYANPGGGYSYHEAAVLIGQWREDARFDWELSPYICNDPEASTRGAVEPTIAQFPDGRILMVLRGSNDAKPHLPGYRWYTVSHDEGDSWAPVRPWTYDTGEAFFSPSSMSQLLTHSSGAYYWLGNISPTNPSGNAPRYPLYLGRVDPGSLRLVKDSLCEIDTRRPGEHEAMTLSNFHAHEDRVTGDILLHMGRWLTNGPEDWTADALLYR
ncbi:MAG TPA: sialidase family protein, partial [Armatimonadota bacterium]|nr:sialidase family protein [Armatimonadota bacterium]